MLDFAEFEKNKEHFLIVRDKFSGALHLAGMVLGGTSEEAIDAVQNFARSSTKYIRKKLWWIEEASSHREYSSNGQSMKKSNYSFPQLIDQTQTNTQRAV